MDARPSTSWRARSTRSRCTPASGRSSCARSSGARPITRSRSPAISRRRGHPRPSTRASRVWTEADYETARRAFDVELAFVGETIAAGATILVGSDAPNPFVVPGWSLHRELELLVRAGLSPQQVLTRATSGNAGALRIGHM